VNITNDAKDNIANERTKVITEEQQDVVGFWPLVRDLLLRFDIPNEIAITTRGSPIGQPLRFNLIKASHFLSQKLNLHVAGSGGAFRSIWALGCLLGPYFFSLAEFFFP
jgi:hypothetical protein